MEKQRIRHSVFMGEEIWDKVSNTYKAEGFRTHSEFIEMAIIHYCAYLASNNTDDFLPKLIGQVATMLMAATDITAVMMMAVIQVLGTM